MVAFSFTKAYLRKISTFLILLAVLLVATAGFNVKFSWGGVDLILRVYVYALAFLLIYNVNSLNYDIYKLTYKGKYGIPRGRILLILESRLLPYLLIYGMVLLFGLVSFIGQNYWPLSAIVRLFEGKYTNVLMYSLFLSLLLRYQKNPVITVPLFLLVLVFFYWLDYYFQNTLQFGLGYTVYKCIKLVMFFFLALWDLIPSVKKFIYYGTTAFFLTIIVYGSSVGYTYVQYRLAGTMFELKRFSGLQLSRIGYPFALNDLAHDAFIMKDPGLLAEVDKYMDAYGMRIDSDPIEWETLLFALEPDGAETTAKLMNKYKVYPDYRKIIEYTKNWNLKEGNTLFRKNNFSVLAAASLRGNEKYLFEQIQLSGKNYTIWGLQVLGLTSSAEVIPFVAKYLTHIDLSVSAIAYASLRNITRLDPERTQGYRINSPETMKVFIDFYHQKNKAAQ